MLTESLLLAFGGAAIGLPLAFAATRVLAGLKTFSVPLLQTVKVDLVALAFTLLVAFGAGLLFGVAPALQMSGADAHEDLKDAGRGSSDGRRRARARKALVVSEVALACVLLVGAGLLIRSFKRLLEVDLGFRPEQAAAWRIETGGRFQNNAQQVAFFKELVRSVEAIPGVESVGLTDTLPLGRNRSWGVRAKGETYPDGQVPIAFPRIIDHGYLKTMRIPLRAGRDFTEMDREGQPLVAVVNEELVRQYFPHDNPVGARIRWARDAGPPRWMTIIGVASDVKQSGLNQPVDPAVYTPFVQSDEVWRHWMTLVIRTDNSSSGLIEQVKAQVWRVDRQIPVSDVQTMEQRMAVSLAQQRFNMLLLGAFAALALILAGVGIYGVMGYTASQRTHEIGIRMALGGQRRDVLRLIVAEGAKLTFAGILIGIVGALALTRVMAGLLFEVKPGDPAIFAVVAILLALVALAACYIPARRATKVDPMVALRYE